MLPQQRRRFDFHAACRHARGPAQQTNVAVFGVGEVVDEVALVEVWVVEQVAGFVDLACAHPLFREFGHGLLLGFGAGPGSDLSRQFGAVLLPRGGTREAFVFEQVRLADGAADRGPHARIHRHDEYIVVRAAGCAGIERDERVAAVAHARRGSLAIAGVRDGGAHVVRHSFLHGEFDELALAGALLLRPGGGDGEGGLHAGAGVAHGGAGTHGRTVGVAGDGEGAGRGLRHHVHALVVRVGAAGAKALDAQIDDLRVALAHHVVADVELLDDTGAVVLDEDIVLRRHRQQQLPALGRAEVERDAALVRVPDDEVLPVDVVAGGAAPPWVADAGLLHLHHVGAEPGEALRAGCARLVLRHVENPHSVKRRHRSPPSRLMRERYHGSAA